MRIETANRLGEVKEYFFSKKLREIQEMRDAGISVINLGIGNPDLPPSENTIEKLKSECVNPSSHGYQSYIGSPQLREAFSNLLPEDFLARRKQGFTVPLANWFRGDLRQMGQSLLLENRDLDQFFKVEFVSEIWQQHQQQKVDHGTLLWSLLSFALWQKEYLI